MVPEPDVFFSQQDKKRLVPEDPKQPRNLCDHPRGHLTVTITAPAADGKSFLVEL